MNHHKYTCPNCGTESFLPDYMGEFCPVCDKNQTGTRLELVKAVQRRDQAAQRLREALK